MVSIVLPTEDTWIPTEEKSAPGRVRRTAVHYAQSLGFTEHRTGEVAIAATELATNVYRHAKNGVVLVRAYRERGEGAVEIIVVDSGPGVSDFLSYAADGRTTSDTLGVGLGAVMRAATWFDAYSLVGKGTAIVTTFWPTCAPAALPVAGGMTRSMNGENACGDAWSERSEANARVLLLVDGLGHGELAAIAAREAVRTFSDEKDPIDLAEAMRRLDRALQGTRGAAGALVRVNRQAKRVQCAGVGNISVWVDDGIKRHGLFSMPGIVGSGVKKVRVVEADLPDGSVIVMHSDGLSAKWNLQEYPGLRMRDPRVIAATILRDAGIHHDDASVVVA